MLARAVESVLQQTVQPFEIIVVDDGSTDNTAETIASKYPDITLLRQTNRGVSNARNKAIHHAKGDWIALLDSDDEWLPLKLETQTAAIKAEPQFRLCHSDEIWIRKGKRVNPMHKHRKTGGWIYPACLPLCAISPSAALIEKTLFAEVGNFNESFPACEDYDLWLRICCQHPVLYVDQPLLQKYGGHEDQLSARYWGMDRFRLLSLRMMLSNPSLDDTNRQLTKRVLKEKLDVYIGGARKRSRNQEADYWEKCYSRHL